MRGCGHGNKGEKEILYPPLHLCSLPNQEADASCALAHCVDTLALLRYVWMVSRPAVVGLSTFLFVGEALAIRMLASTSVVAADLIRYGTYEASAMSPCHGPQHERSSRNSSVPWLPRIPPWQPTKKRIHKIRHHPTCSKDQRRVCAGDITYDENKQYRTTPSGVYSAGVVLIIPNGIYQEYVYGHVKWSGN
jgi:hypothetical protein